ncbi:hypothetical protein BB561_003449 [Smittium simulii]|uniref:Inositolphosphotransferase Aur1/Ipt1 domain-containing protein n=1 Tax=Smittium simulii TaxID=133385 RepID=A0A2T9YLC7_9FUNG|nr:hypothetical protein BB561_003449 [Smittium simulii]
MLEKTMDIYARLTASPKTRILLFLAFEIAIIAIAFTTNFSSAYIHKKTLPFETFREKATNSALLIVKIEKSLGIYFEEALQKWHLENIGGLRLWNAYYAAAHPFFAITTILFLLLRSAWHFFKHDSWTLLSQPDSSGAYSSSTPSSIFKINLKLLSPFEQYIFIRTVYLLSIFISFISFVLAPAMPPRLLNDCSFKTPAGLNMGACLTEYPYIDTIGTHGSIFFTWSDPSVVSLNNPYASMPSQHALVAFWVALAWFVLSGLSKYSTRAFYFRNKSRYYAFLALRYSTILYPILTTYCIFVTANHFFLDKNFPYNLYYITTPVWFISLPESPHIKLQNISITDTESGTSCNWMGLELVYPELKKHINYVFKIRNGTYWTARRYAKSGFIEKKYIEECPFCRNIAPETIEHMLLEFSSGKRCNPTY